MKNCLLSMVIVCAFTSAASGQATDVLFDGTNLDAWEFREGAWVIDVDKSLTCRMETVANKKGKERQVGMGYLWTKNAYDDFVLTLRYKLSPQANSGVFFRTDPNDPVQGGFEIQLADNVGFQQARGKKDPKNLHGALYDAQAASTNPDRGVGTWNLLKLTCVGASVEVEINGVSVNRADLSRWTVAGKNPDGSSNKFKTALGSLPRRGRVGFQNHGQVVWFKDIRIRPLGGKEELAE